MNKKILTIIIFSSVFLWLISSIMLKKWLFWEEIKNMVFVNNQDEIKEEPNLDLSNTGVVETNTWKTGQVENSGSIRDKPILVNTGVVNNISNWNIFKDEKVVYTLTTGFPISTLIKNWMITLTIFDLQDKKISFIWIPYTLLVSDWNWNNRIIWSYNAEDIKTFLEFKLGIKINYLENTFDTSSEIENFYTNIIEKENYKMIVNWQEKQIRNKDVMINYANWLSFYNQKDMQEIQINLLKALYNVSLMKTPAEWLFENKELVSIFEFYKTRRNTIDYWNNYLNAIDLSKTLFDTISDYQWIPWIYYKAWNEKWFWELKQIISTITNSNN